MRPIHTPLLLPSVVVGLLVIFGSGFILGMWYHTHQQLGSVASVREPASARASAASPGERGQEALTFYQTLTTSHLPYAPLTPTPEVAPAAEARDHEPQGSASSAQGEPLISPSPAPLASAAPAAAPAEPTARLHATPTRHAAPKDHSEPRRTAGRPPVPRRSTKSATPPGALTQGAPARVGASTHARRLSPSQEERRRPQSRAAAPSTTPAGTATQHGLSVQVGSFGTLERADRLRQRLERRGYPARVQASTVPGQGVRYRVRVGNYATTESANQTAGHLTVQEQVPAVIAR
ncbi:MAG: SPOR domain-containing protein [Candidatus Tectimicrobiota bacterium]